MATWNLGSVAAEVFILMDNIPTAVSGAPLLRIVDRRLNYMETYLSKSIGSNSITGDYQDPLLNLTMSSLLKHSQVLGTDAKSVTIGEFKIDKGSNSSGETVSMAYEKEAMAQLARLKGQFNFYRTF